MFDTEIGSQSKILVFLNPRSLRYQKTLVVRGWLPQTSGVFTFITNGIRKRQEHGANSQSLGIYFNSLDYWIESILKNFKSFCCGELVLGFNLYKSFEYRPKQHYH